MDRIKIFEHEMYFTPGNIGTLVFMVSLVIGIIYFLLLRKKSFDLLLLTGLLVVFLAYQFSTWFFDAYAATGIINIAGFDQFPVWATLTSALFGLTSVLLVHFTYQIRFRFRVWEGRAVLAGAMLALVWILGIIASKLPDSLHQHSEWIGYFFSISYALIAWSFIVSIRKTWFAFRKRFPPETQKMIRILSITLFGWTVVSLSRSTVLDLRFSSDEFRMVVGNVGLFLVVALLIYGVLLYGADRHTVLAKLV